MLLAPELLAISYISFRVSYLFKFVDCFEILTCHVFLRVCIVCLRLFIFRHQRPGPLERYRAAKN